MIRCLLSKEKNFNIEIHLFKILCNIFYSGIRLIASSFLLSTVLKWRIKDSNDYNNNFHFHDASYSWKLLPFSSHVLGAYENNIRFNINLILIYIWSHILINVVKLTQVLLNHTLVYQVNAIFPLHFKSQIYITRYLFIWYIKISTYIFVT